MATAGLYLCALQRPLMQDSPNRGTVRIQGVPSGMNQQGYKVSQRARLMVLLLVILVLGLISQSVLINGYLLNTFKRLEENQLRASAHMITLWLDGHLQPLNRLADSVASWDSSRRALDGGHEQAWIRELQAASTRATFDSAALIDPDGVLVSSVALDPAAGVSTAANPALRRLLTLAGGTPAGWTATGNALFASVSRPIPGTEPEAYVVLGRYFNEISYLEELSSTRIAALTAGERQDLEPGMIPGEFRRGGEGNQALELCRSLVTPSGLQRRLLCMQLRDSIYLRGKAMADDLRLATITGFVALILVAWVFLDRALMRRLQRLVEQLAAAGDSSTESLETALLADSRRGDELGQLSGGMGQLLAKVRTGESKLRQQQENFRSLTESTGVGIFVLRDRIIYANPFAETITGYTFLELLERRLPDLLHPNDRERIGARLRDTLSGASGGRSTEDEVQGQTRDGGRYWARLHTVTLHYEGEPAVLVTLYDTSEQRHLQAAIAREKERLQVILSSIQDGIVSLDARGRVNYLNTSAERLIGHTVESAIGKPLKDVALFSDAQSGQALPSSALDSLMHGGSALQSSIMTGTGDLRHVELRRSPLLSAEGGDRPGSVVVLRDVSELRRMTTHLEHQASHDELTGLYNRREFNARLQAALADCRGLGVPYALCYLDLDQFKTVNDICGHQAGDQMLKQITAALRVHLRPDDMVARLGGDEFGLLLRCPAEAAIQQCDQIRAAISDIRFAWGGRTFTVDGSIGIAMLDQVEGDMDEALSIVDATCYVAKEEGRNRVKLYRPGDVDLQRQFGQMRWAQTLKDALEQQEFVLYQQGIHPLKAGDPPASEILIRLRDSVGKPVSAVDFIDAAERYQMMPAMDRYVVQGALTHMLAEHEALGKIERTYFINLSGHSLGDETFHRFLLDSFSPRDSKLTPHVVFEVTESAVISNFGRARKLMQELRRRGCRFALDDFGTGMSSFGYLKELDVQFLKIAGPFVRNLPRDALDQAIVRNFANFGRQLGLQVIAEWVEDEETLALLRDMGVDYAQGYVLDKPAPLARLAPQSAVPVTR